MNDRVVRELVREAIARHLTPPRHPERGPSEAALHPSHGVYLHLATLADTCLIEPAIRCSHCNYCKSHGY